MSFLPLFLSVIPFIVFLVLLLVRRTSLLISSATALLLVLFTTLFYWQIVPALAVTSLIKGVLVAFDIFIIIFGAIFFLEILKSINTIDSISYYLESISKDYRIKVILLAWFFGNFLEGTSGFGTAGVIIAPLLVGLGLTPIKAVILTLLGNSTSVAFGAAGTPIRVGFANLETISSIPVTTAMINCIGFIVPVFILAALVSDLKEKKIHFREAFPFAVWSGVVFVIPSLLSAYLGNEFPSILGSIVGLIIVTLSTKLGFFVPKNIRSLQNNEDLKNITPSWKDILPYGLLILLFLASKFVILSAGISILGAKHLFNFSSPGFCFILAGLLVVLFWKRHVSETVNSAIFALKKAIEPFSVIAFMSALTQLMLSSGVNYSGYVSSLEIIAKGFENNFLPFLSPLIGAFGSFLTGSATVSNIMFGSLLFKAGNFLNYNPGVILSLELVGAAAGNMIALADMLAAQTVVGLKGEERTILKNVIVPSVIYVFLAGLIGLLII